MISYLDPIFALQGLRFENVQLLSMMNIIFIKNNRLITSNRKRLFEIHAFQVVFYFI